MSQEVWTAVDEYINGHVAQSDPQLDFALESAKAADLPAINVAPNQGKLLQLLAQLSGARRILEIGTLGGYSTIWLARALPTDGRLVTIEFDSKHAAVAQRCIENAGLGATVDIRVGSALEVLPAIQSEGAGLFDFIFIDADKVNNPHYLGWALKLSHVGTVIICDNVIRDGAIVDEANTDPGVVGTRQFFDALRCESGLFATAIQTVGSKGYDGFAIGIVTSNTSSSN